MRNEASLEQWKILYETATRIRERKPWDKFWDMDLIGVRNGAEDDTVFFSILGRGDECYGIAVYEGFTGLNRFLMMAMQQHLNLAPECAMYYQNHLACFWGDREELTEKQRRLIKELGYKYRGKNQWLYFQSFQPGYCPCNLDGDELLRMSGHLQDLELALRCYEETGAAVDFEKGNMFLLTFEEDKKKWHCGEAPLPFTVYQYRNVLIQDEEVLAELEKVPDSGAVLEAGLSVLGLSVADRDYDRPLNPMLALLGDASSEIILKFEMVPPEESPAAKLAEIVVEYIFQHGVPGEIRVSDVIVEAGLEQICDICGITLRRVEKLSGLNSFVQSMRRMHF